MMPFPAKSKGTTSRRNADSRTGNVATIALLAALALIFSYVEAIIPYNPGVPGIKLGIADIVALVALYRLSAKHAAAVNVIRILIAGLLFNGVFGALYSLGGAALSLLGMVALKKTDKFSIAGVSTGRRRAAQHGTAPGGRPSASGQQNFPVLSGAPVLRNDCGHRHRSRCGGNLPPTGTPLNNWVYTVYARPYYIF